MFFFLRIWREAGYLLRLMRFLLPLIIAVSFVVPAVQAQEQSPTPSAPEATPQPSPSASPAETPKDSPAGPEATPATSSTETSASPSATPSVGAPVVSPSDVTPETSKPDVIPMDGQPAASPTSGAPLDTKDLAPTVPRTDEAMPDDAFTKPNAVIPDESTPQAPTAPQTAESAQEKARQVNIHYKEVRVTAEKDPKIVAMLAKADAAKSEEDRRAALREYYRMLFKKISTVDASLTQKCNDLEAAYVRRLSQYRLEPTIPLNPPPTPEPLSH